MGKDERLGSDPFNFLSETSESKNENSNIEASDKNNETKISSPKKTGNQKKIKAKKIDVIIKEQNSKKVLLKLNGEMTIYSIDEINIILQENIKDYNGIELELSHINKIDSSGFQLLFLSKNECNKMKKSFKIIDPSNDVKRIFELYGENIN